MHQVSQLAVCYWRVQVSTSMGGRYNFGVPTMPSLLSYSTDCCGFCLSYYKLDYPASHDGPQNGRWQG
jgi:hypothetical protein